MTQDAAGFSIDTGPNSVQIGGDHYVSDYQPWDFNEDFGLGGLECSIVKYLCRYKVKGSAERDINKAIHYVEKLIDLHDKRNRVPKGCASLYGLVKFSHIQGLEVLEKDALTLISRWSCRADLVNCCDILDCILKGLKDHDGDP